MTNEQESERCVNLPDRISDVVKPWAEHSPDQLALVEDTGAWTYRQLASAISDTQDLAREPGCASRRSGHDRGRELPGVRDNSFGLGRPRCMACAGKRPSLAA